MAEDVICDLERSRSSVKVKKFSIRSPPLTISTHVKFLPDLIASFVDMVEQLLT